MVAFPVNEYALLLAYLPSRWGQEAELARAADYGPRWNTRERSPILVLTGLDVEQLGWRGQTGTTECLDKQGNTRHQTSPAVHHHGESLTLGIRSISFAFAWPIMGKRKAPFTRYNLLSNRLYNRFDNRLYRVNKH